MAGLSLDLRARRGTFTLEAAFTLEPGLTALVGPSGAGKTTLLRLIAGLERPESGHLSWDGTPWVAPGLFVQPQARRVGVVFQDLALFPHLTVLENVMFGASRAQALAWLERLEIADLASRASSRLSAGQAQRVAIARALAPEPRLLLLDEPFSSLDPPLKERLYEVFARAIEARDLPVLLVTHDWAEACRLADRLIVIAGGAIAQIGPPASVLDQPASPLVASLSGVREIFHATAEGPATLAGVPWPVATRLVPGARYAWAIRPDRIVLGAGGPPARVLSARPAPYGWHVSLALTGLAGPLSAIVPAAVARDLTPGHEVGCSVAPEALLVWPAAEDAPGIRNSPNE